MTAYERNRILRDLDLCRGPSMTRHFRVIAERHGVTRDDVKQVHEDECQRRKRAHDQRRRAAMQGVVLI